MGFAHLAIGSNDVNGTADFLCAVLGFELINPPGNVPLDVAWLDISEQRNRLEQIHIIRVEDFEISEFDREFGRHFAVFHRKDDFEQVKSRVVQFGGEVIDPIRETPFPRFFFREPLNGYIFEVISKDDWVVE